MNALHPSDGTDERGRGLEIVIRIGADGRVYLHDLTDEMIPVALTLNPQDSDMRRRAAAAATFQAENPR